MTSSSTSRVRANRDVWLNAAYELFVTDGIEAVKIMSLAERLDLTRTGFYWHFKDLSDLHDAIVDMWLTRNTGVIVDRCAAPAQSLCAALFNLVDCWIDRHLFDAPLDLAIRNWARNNEGLQALVDRSDADRLAAVRALFVRFGAPKEDAHFRALTVLLTQTGYHSMRVSESRSDRAKAGCHYVGIFAGEAPTRPEIDAFLARYTSS